MERIDKVFSGLGILSRSECKAAVKKGLILVNGETIKSSDVKIDTSKDEISYKGTVLEINKYVYYMLNKPADVITATKDEMHKTVFDLVEDKRPDLAAVGRLDKDTTGILILTNDGKLNHNLLSPRHHVPKTYEVVIEGELSEDAISLLEEGVDIGDDKPTLPAVVNVIKSDAPQKIELTITEGRFHQVKRMLAAVGNPVIKLHRSKFGELLLDSKLEPGEYRALTEEEVELLTAWK